MSLQSLIIRHNLPSTIVEDIVKECDVFEYRCRDLCTKLEVSVNVTEQIINMHKKLNIDLHPLAYIYLYVYENQKLLEECFCVSDILEIPIESEPFAELGTATNTISIQNWCCLLGEYCEDKNFIPKGVYRIYDDIADLLAENLHIYQFSP